MIPLGSIWIEYLAAGKRRKSFHNKKTKQDQNIKNFFVQKLCSGVSTIFQLFSKKYLGFDLFFSCTWIVYLPSRYRLIEVLV